MAQAPLAVSPNIKPHHLSLLADIIRAGGAIAEADLDGRVLRPLRAGCLVATRKGSVVTTPAGRAAAQSFLAGDSVQAGLRGARVRPEPKRLSEPQEDVLREICRQGRSVLVDTFDGRVVRSLKGYGFVEESEGWLTATAAGREHFEQHVRRRRRVPADRDSGGRTGRVEAIQRCIERLELAISTHTEVMVGDMPASIGDILAGLRHYASRLERSGRA